VNRRTFTGQPSAEGGQVIVMFALLVPMLLALGGFVIGVGNWYTHGKHLQTKADSGAFAGGSTWRFPCDAFVDADIEAQARLYAGAQNPQVGNVPNSNIHTVLNGPLWFDNDSNPSPIQWSDPPSNPVASAGALCRAMTLDVKVTEDNSFPLASLIPLFPDIKRKARIEIREAETILEDLLPIAVRAPEPVSAAAVFYDERSAQKTILGVKYFVRNDTIGVPGNLQGWTTLNPEDLSVPYGSWAGFTPTSSSTGVAIAVSFRGACYDTSIPGYDPGNPDNNPPTQNNIAISISGPCFQESYVGQPIASLCNQGSSLQIVNCYYATGNWPTESVQSGLQFIRGYSDFTPGNGVPSVEGAWLSSANCSVQGIPSPAYFNAHPNSSCNARLHLRVDAGTIQGDYPPGNPVNLSNLRAEDVQIRYKLVRADGTVVCNFGNTCELQGSGSGNNMSFTTTGLGSFQDLPLAANSLGNAVALQIRIQNAPNHPNSACHADAPNFSAQCQWYWVGNRMFSTTQEPTAAEILAEPVQRAFRGNSLASSSIQWLRLVTDPDCNPVNGTLTDTDAASVQLGGNRCFQIEMGRKGGVATDQSNQPILFNDGVGSSQMGAVDCDPNVGQGQMLIIAVQNGCAPEYAAHPFDWNPLCPAQNQLFNGYPTGNPGTPWNDGRWPPIRCVKTRPTGSMNQLERGLDNRFFGSNNAPCPADSPTGPVPGRNYWSNANNQYDGVTYKTATSPNNISKDWDDPRLVTIFLVPTEAFTGSGQNTYPITGFIDVYITGYGRIQGNGNLNVDDPCPGSAPPSDLDLSGGSSSGYAVWGHVINHVHRGGGATGGPNPCRPGITTQPCAPVLVE
jgi:hypothetical protein